jgi:hypothetical protein
MAEQPLSRLSDDTPVSLALEEITIALGVIEDECDNYGGWAGEDQEANEAVDLAQRLMGLAWVVAIHGREAAESGL